jgi:light-harvesting complex 1 beta chain
MSIAHDHSAFGPRERRQQDERDYRWVFWLALPFFLASAVVSRLSSARGETAGPSPRQSVFRQAWVAANSSIPFAFMN